MEQLLVSKILPLLESKSFINLIRKADKDFLETFLIPAVPFINKRNIGYDDVCNEISIHAVRMRETKGIGWLWEYLERIDFQCLCSMPCMYWQNIIELRDFELLKGLIGRCMFCHDIVYLHSIYTNNTYVFENMLGYMHPNFTVFLNTILNMNKVMCSKLLQLLVTDADARSEMKRHIDYNVKHSTYYDIIDTISFAEEVSMIINKRGREATWMIKQIKRLQTVVGYPNVLRFLKTLHSDMEMERMIGMA